MAYFPDVQPGDPFQPNALLSNNIRHLINRMNGVTGGAIIGTPSGIVKVKVYCENDLETGTAVNFKEGGSFCEDAIPCIKFKDATKPWGVIARGLAAHEIGECIISGPATIKTSGSSGDFAEPQASDPVTFKRGTSGAQILFTSGEKSIINLGAATTDVYTGPFAMSYDAQSKKIKVAAGYLSRNGEFVEVPATEIAPANGVICVCSTIREGEWSKPEIKIATPAKENYPIGSCEVKNESVNICCYRVSVAMIIISAECPLSVDESKNNE